MEVTGILKVKGESQQVSEKFRKREFVITTEDTYPQHISIQLTQDKCSLIDAIAVGSEIKVHINLRGREWTSPKGEVKYFNTIEAWRIEGRTAGANTTSSNEMSGVAETFTATTQEDDLPF